MKTSRDPCPTYRKANKRDLETLLQIEKEMTKTPLYHTLDKDEFEKYLLDSEVFLLYLNKQAVGYFSYKIGGDKDMAEIDGIAILEKFRHQGLGTFVLKLLLDKLKDFRTIKLVTHPHNSNSLRLYLKFGFIIKEWIDNYFGNEPRLVLHKTS